MSAMRQRFTVTAERGKGRVWVFQCVEHPGAISEGRKLSDGQDLMREAIAFVAGVPEDSFDIDVRPVLPIGRIEEARAARRASLDAAQRQMEAAGMLRIAARHLLDDGLTGADAAVVLEVSPQRISQLIKS